VSGDNTLVLHCHPDDYGNIASMSNTGAFYFQTTFPKGGQYYIAASFMFSSDGINFREGFGQTLLTVGGTPAMETNVTWNYTNAGSFAKYPIVGGVYDEWVDSATNFESNGVMTNFIVVNSDLSMSMMSNNMMNINNPMPGGMNINITAGRCSPFFFNFYTAPNVSAPLKPFLGAPVHFTLISEDDAIYHAHGTYLPAGISYYQMLMSVMNMSTSIMTGDMNMMMTDPMYNLSMNAMMMGVEMNGTLNCLQDMGSLMNMAGMNMSEYYGPDTFGPTVVGIFEWPNLGNWRIWAYTGIDNGDGTTSLLVPQFDVNVVYVPQTQMTTMGMPMPSMNGADKFGVSILVFLLCAIISLF